MSLLGAYGSTSQGRASRPLGRVPQGRLGIQGLWSWVPVLLAFGADGQERQCVGSGVPRTCLGSWVLLWSFIPLCWDPNCTRLKTTVKCIGDNMCQVLEKRLERVNNQGIFIIGMIGNKSEFPL